MLLVVHSAIYIIFRQKSHFNDFYVYFANHNAGSITPETWVNISFFVFRLR